MKSTYPVQFVEEDDVTATIIVILQLQIKSQKQKITKTMITGSPETPGAKITYFR